MHGSIFLLHLNVSLLVADDPQARCPTPPKGINSRKIPGAVRPRRVGGQIHYECRKRFPYAVGGANVLTCQVDGSYDASPLECSGMLDLGRVKVECSGVLGMGRV